MSISQVNPIDDENIPEGSETTSNTYLEKSEEVLENSPTPIGENSNTYTENTLKNTEENNTKTTTTDSAVVCCCDDSLLTYIKEKFCKYTLTDKEIILIANATKDGINDIDRVYEYITNYTKPIKNIVPFIIATIKNGWIVHEPIEPAKEKSHKDLYGFESRDYDFDALEKELVNRF